MSSGAPMSRHDPTQEHNKDGETPIEIASAAGLPPPPTPFQFAAIIENRIKKHEAIHRGDINPQEDEQEQQNNAGKNPGQPRENLAPIDIGDGEQTFAALALRCGEIEVSRRPAAPSTGEFTE